MMKLLNVAVMGALAAVAATAWANHESASNANGQAVAEEQVPSSQGDGMMRVAGVSASESLSPNEQLVSPSDDAAARPLAAVPVEDHSVAVASITVEERRLTDDQRIQADVMDKLAALQNVSGKIGVESHDAKVILTGYTSTAGQASRAERAARSVRGVNDVQNEIRSRIGGSV